MAIKRVLTFMILFLSFFLIYLGIHFYVLYRIFGMLGLDRGIKFILILILVSLTLPAVSIIERIFTNLLVRVFYALSATIFGIVFFMFFSLLIYETLNLFFSFDQRSAGIVIVVFVFVVALYSVINSLFVVEKTLNINFDDLDREYKIVQLSDLHLGSIRNSGFVSSLVDRINRIDPDLVLITGDITDGAALFKKKTVLPLERIKAKTFFTIGNHERYSGPEKVSELLRSIGIVVLRNESEDYKGLQIIGIDDPEDELSKKNCALEKITVNKSKLSILMYHPPKGIDDAKKKGIDLQLSGHTHNGQIFPFNLIVKLFFPYIRGLYNIEGMYLYVSPGTGTWGPPMRLGSRNEITIINLIPK